jgi:hypothetical protein
MIDTLRVNVVREVLKSLEECEVEDSEQHHSSLVKGKCVLDLFVLRIIFNHSRPCLH